MKIYFEDSQLCSKLQRPHDTQFTLDATYGPSENIKFLDTMKDSNPDAIIYTNSIFAFSNTYAWNPIEKVPEVYIRAGEHMIFTRIDKLTVRELREGHNLKKMYLSGEFDTTTEDATNKACKDLILKSINNVNDKLLESDLFQICNDAGFPTGIIVQSLNYLIAVGSIVKILNVNNKLFYRLSSEFSLRANGIGD